MHHFLSKFHSNRGFKESSTQVHYKRFTVQKLLQRFYNQRTDRIKRYFVDGMMEIDKIWGRKRTGYMQVWNRDVFFIPYHLRNEPSRQYILVW